MQARIRHGFEKSATQYDFNSGLHRQIADQLFAQVAKEPQPAALLDVGCGTGYLTVKLKERFPQSKIVGLDFSAQMLEAARPKNDGIAWVLGDCHHLPFCDSHFDSVVSNLAYQWADDLLHAFSEARRVLSPNGVLACTLFGFHTCQELFQSLDEAKSQTLQFTRLPDVPEVRQALVAGGFKNPKIDVERIKIEFSGMHELISWLKSIGANNLSREGFLGPEAIAKAAGIYRKKFSYLQGVGATFEVVRVYVKS